MGKRHGTNNRRINMKTLGSLCLSLALANGASAATITFDDITTGGFQVVPNGYAGLTLNNFDIQNVTKEGASGFTNSAVSGSYAAYNGNGNPASISSTQTFALASGFFTAGWVNGLLVHAVGTLASGDQVSHDFTINATGPTNESFNWSHLVGVTFSSSGGTSAGFVSTAPIFAVDNLTVTATAVPEPGRLPLLLLGMPLVLALTKSKKATGQPGA
jgi:hypothetical protein